MELTQPFVKLPLQFDVERLQHELASLDDTQWMAHPSGLVGNSAIPLIARDGKDNNEFSGHMQATRHLQRCEYLQQVLASFGEVLGRSRLMKLAAGSEVSRHVDFNYHWYTRVRIHIPIVTFPEVLFYCGDEQVHMQAGECWIFDSWRHHNVINSSDFDRTHLVLDTAGSSRFWGMVRQAQEEGSDIRQPQTLPYKPGAKVDISTERFNSAPVMAPGEMDALAQGLIADFEANPANDKRIVLHYKTLLLDLCKDWREVWLLHGYHKSGWPLYQSVLETAKSKMHPEMRALVTNSNKLGVNPIIMQRILRAALNKELSDDFLNQGD
ncbi:MAG: aspartyl/asparaginyl beta-hydroxylase domain-containing protein [Pseudomonadales bacterium]